MKCFADEGVRETLQLGLPVVGAEKTDLLEGKLDLDRDPVVVTTGSREITVPLQPFEIATLAIELQESEPHTMELEP